jgi:hypothetical protein
MVSRTLFAVLVDDSVGADWGVVSGVGTVSESDPPLHASSAALATQARSTGGLMAFLLRMA